MVLKHRRHWFEFGDQTWIRGRFREVYNEALNFGQTVGGHYRRMAPAFARWASGHPSGLVLDLASGGAAPLKCMMESAREHEPSMPKLVCSDLHPDLERLRRLSSQFGTAAIDHLPLPVSALDVPPDLPKMRSICSALHHFREEDAARIIENTLKDGGGLFVMEPFERNFRHLAMLLLAGPWIYLWAPFFSERFSLLQLLLCTLIPIVPFMIFWDGVVSVLRIHTTQEIVAMIPESIREQVEIETGYAPYLFGCRATYVALRAAATESHLGQRPPQGASKPNSKAA